MSSRTADFALFTFGLQNLYFPVIVNIIYIIIFIYVSILIRLPFLIPTKKSNYEGSIIDYREKKGYNYTFILKHETF